MLLMSQFCFFWTAFRTPSLGCQCVCWALWSWFPAVRLLECLHLVIWVSVSIWILTTIFFPLALSPIVRTLIFSSCWSFWFVTKGTNDNFFLSTFCTNSKFTGTCERVLHCLLWTYNSLLSLRQWFVFAVFYTPFKSFFVALTYSMTSWIDFLALEHSYQVCHFWRWTYFAAFEAWTRTTLPCWELITKFPDVSAAFMLQGRGTNYDGYEQST